MKHLLTFIILAALLFPRETCAFVIDRIEAVVNGEVITKSEVDRAVRSESQRRGIHGEGASSKLRDEVLDALIDKELILGDARRFNIVEVTEQDVDAAVASVRSEYPSEEAFMRALEEDGMTVEELRENLAEQMLVVKYVDRRVRFFVRVTLDDQKRYYQEHIEDFEDRGFNEVHDKVHDILVEKQTDEKLREYIADLRERADIIINRPGNDVDDGAVRQ